MEDGPTDGCAIARAEGIARVQIPLGPEQRDRGTVTAMLKAAVTGCGDKRRFALRQTE
jgi:hypothetical protein